MSCKLLTDRQQPGSFKNQCVYAVCILRPGRTSRETVSRRVVGKPLQSAGDMKIIVKIWRKMGQIIRQSLLEGTRSVNTKKSQKQLCTE